VPPPPLGKLITFYSYKGGTGRSMAVANVACLLGKRLSRTSQRVLVMDWDLEAPGLHRFFFAKSDLPEYEVQPGVINYFYSLRELLTDQAGLYEKVTAPEGWRILDEKLSLEKHCIPDVVQGVDFMPAGRFGPGYAKLVGSFNWVEFFNRFGAVIATFRELLAEKFAYTLVDSRTGLTDVSGICTTLLPEKLVGVFTPNRQSLSGLCDLVKEAIEYRGKSDDFRPLAVFPLPSRVENAEQDLKTQWRREYQTRFENLLGSAHEADRCDLTAYFNDVLLPHVSYYAYGENIAVLQDRQDAISLAAAYQRFFDRLIDSNFAWEVSGAEKPEAPTAQVSPAPLVGEKYDAFLSYVAADEKDVSQLDAQLRRYRVKTFFPFRDLAPGEDWSAGTAAGMAASKATVVFVGEGGSGPWQDQESVVALENYAKDSTKRIIPVLLPKAPSSQLRLPNFLRNVHWVDLRAGLKDREAIGNLAWALTGERRTPKKDLMWWLRAVAAGLVALIFTLGFLVSFAANRSLEKDVQTTISELRSVPFDPNQLPSLGGLQKLERLRQALATLESYQTDGAPLRLRWGLYVGNRICPEARKAYFDNFRRLLFADIQNRLLNALRTLPYKPSRSDTYQNTYNELKAYLITTSNNDKSTKDFLSPLLVSQWSIGRGIDADRIALARTQFDFYSKELAAANPFSASNDTAAIAQARNYLSLFGSTDRFYSTLVEQASLKNPAADFNQQFHEAAGVVYSGHKVRGAFTRGGFAFMKGAILNPAAYASGEEWVLGKTTALELDQSTLQQKLTELYDQDFVNEWHTVLQTSLVAGYGSLKDAESKLGKLASPTSPLLELFWFISHNTDVGVASVTAPFLPVQAVVPPGPPGKLPEQFIFPNNKDYVLALSKLQSNLGALAQNSMDPVLVKQVSDSAAAAKDAVTKILVGAPIDQKYHDESLVDKLLRQPILNAEALLKGQEANALNGAAGPLCAQFAQLNDKYPFNPNSGQDLTLDQLNSILAPKTGALWTFYDNSLAKYLAKQGSRYVEIPVPKMKLSPTFVAFFNRAAGLSDALYPGGSATPKFAYSLKALPSNVDTVLKIGGDTPSGIGQQKTFTWTGAPGDVQVTTKSGDILGSFNGPWSVFKFVADAHSQVSGPVTHLEWIMQSNGRTIMLPNGKAKSYSYELQVNGWNPFRTGDLSGLRCQTPVAH
jgi:MinD-like ATPase involved in chromosome partitioning or flagellar assembly